MSFCCVIWQVSLLSLRNLFWHENHFFERNKNYYEKAFHPRQPTDHYYLLLSNFYTRAVCVFVSLHLGICEVSELVDPHFLGCPGQVVLIDQLHLLRESSKSFLLLCPVQISNITSWLVERILLGLVFLSKLLLELVKPLSNTQCWNWIGIIWTGLNGVWIVLPV